MKRALPGLTVVTSESIAVDEVFGNPAAYQPHPWRSWKTTLNGAARIIRFDRADPIVIPGASQGLVHLFDRAGTELGHWSFSTGWRLLLVNGSLESRPEVSAQVLVVQTGPFLMGRNVARQYFGFSGDRLRFIRMEDDTGAILRNNYNNPNHTLGIVPEAVTLDEWVGLLESHNGVDVLAVLTFIGGVHTKPEDASPSWEHEDISQAEMAQRLQRDVRICDLIARLSEADNDWVREAARLAIAKPPPW